MALRLADRLLTIVVTATLTSAVWIVAGGSLVRVMPAGGGVFGTMGGAASAERVAAADRRSPVIDAGEPSRPMPISAAGLAIPVAGVAPSALVDTFTAARAGGTRIHDAIDIMAPTGTRVTAAADGTVEKLFYSDQGGKTIYVRSPDRRTIHYYAHLDDYAPGLAENRPVKRGQVLGTVGFSGNASPDAPHLHFAVMQTSPQAKWWEPSTALNPYPLLGGSRR